MAARAGVQLLTFLVTIIATRVLSVSDFGVYALAASLVLLSRNLLYVGPYEFLLKTPERAALKGSCLAANLIIALGSGAMLLAFAMLAPALFGSLRFGHVVAALVPSLPIAAFSAWFEALLLRRGRVRRYFTITISAEIASTVIAVAMLAFGVGLASLVTQIYARLLAMMLIYAANVRERPWHPLPRDETRAVLRWSLLRYSTVLMSFVSSYGADFTLAVLISPAATGIYRASNRVVLAISDLFAQPLLKIIQTDLSARVARRLPPGREWLLMFTATATFGWAALAALAMTSREAVPLLLGEKWRAAAPVIAVLCAVRALSLLDVTSTAVLICFDRQRWLMGLQAAVAIGCLGASAALAHHGPLAVAVGNGCVTACLGLGYLRKAARLSGVRFGELLDAVAVALVPAGAVIAAIAIVHRLNPPPLDASPWRALAISALIGGIAFAAGIGLVWSRLALALHHRAFGASIEAAA